MTVYEAYDVLSDFEAKLNSYVDGGEKRESVWEMKVVLMGMKGSLFSTEDPVNHTMDTKRLCQSVLTYWRIFGKESNYYSLFEKYINKKLGE